VGGTHFVEPDYDHGIHKRLRKHFSDKGLVNFDHVAIGRDELCSCCNEGRLLPTACFQGQAS
jgi:formylmethanofuran dehydrogenase subunit A